MNIITILIQATALMAALIILRPLLKRFISARARRALWLIPAARLLFPIEITSMFSIMAPVEPISAGISEAVSRPVDMEAPSWLGSGIGIENAQGTAAVEQSAGSLASVPEAGLSIGNILFVVWLIGAIVTAAIIFRQNMRFNRLVKHLAEPMGNGWGLPVLMVKGLPSPCLAGIIKPKIYINEFTLISDEVLEMTIRHELTHYRRLDHIWNALRGLLLALYWFHPLIWLCSELFRDDGETACDEAATRDMDASQRESYGMALINLASRERGGKAASLVCLSTMSGSKKLLKERISRLASARTLRSAGLIAAMLAIVLTCTMCAMPDDSGNKQLAAPPSPTPGFMGEEPAPAEDEPIATVEPVPAPAMGEEGTLEDLAYFLELCAYDAKWGYMSSYDFEPILEEYGELLDDYRITFRESEDGKYAYIAGEYEGEDGKNPFLPLYAVEIGYSNTNSTVQVLYTEEQQEWVERSMAEANLPKDVITLHNSRVYYTPESNLIIIEPVDVKSSLTVAYSRYLHRQRAYIADAAQRGIALIRPEGPHLEIYMISEKWGEISERIPLTDAEAEAILGEELTEIIPGFGFSAVLYHDDTHELYDENRGIPQTVLDLAVEKCDYRFGDPGMITAPLTEAKLECSWLNEPLYADDLERLGEILKNAQFGYVGSCGYGAKLTVRMGNEMVTMFKGSDGCDSIVFGSYSGYFLGDAENTEFWEIFGLDPDMHEPLE